jgi:hypothetical protein
MRTPIPNTDAFCETLASVPNWTESYPRRQKSCHWWENVLSHFSTLKTELLWNTGKYLPRYNASYRKRREFFIVITVRTTGLTLVPRRQCQQVSEKSSYTSTRQHGITSPKSVFLKLTAVITWNLALVCWLWRQQLYPKRLKVSSTQHSAKCRNKIIFRITGFLNIIHRPVF